MSDLLPVVQVLRRSSTSARLNRVRARRPVAEPASAELGGVLVNGRALYTAVCELGFEGVVAKRRASVYRVGKRGWVKIKNPELLAPRR